MTDERGGLPSGYVKIASENLNLQFIADFLDFSMNSMVIFHSKLLVITRG